jgi:nitrite reductase/ring-hydroxylating ferredoxin subunit
MSVSGEWRGAAALIEPGQSTAFRLRCGGRDVNGFLVNHAGEFHAYVNRCAHAGTPLDTWPNEFFSEDGRYLVCSTHGAVYDPASGLCVEGPCPGARLERLRLERQGDVLVVSCP